MNLINLAFLGILCLWMAILAVCAAVMFLAAWSRRHDEGGDPLEDWRRP